jgi:hypothetical protein
MPARMRRASVAASGSLQPETSDESADQRVTTTLAIVPWTQQQRSGAPAGERTRPAEVFAGSRRPRRSGGRRMSLAWLNMLQRRGVQETGRTKQWRVLFGNRDVDKGFYAPGNQGKPEDDVGKTCACGADPLPFARLRERSCSPKHRPRSPRYEPWASSSPGTKEKRLLKDSSRMGANGPGVPFWRSEYF